MASNNNNRWGEDPDDSPTQLPGIPRFDYQPYQPFQQPKQQQQQQSYQQQQNYQQQQRGGFPTASQSSRVARSSGSEDPSQMLPGTFTETYASAYGRPAVQPGGSSPYSSGGYGPYRPSSTSSFGPSESSIPSHTRMGSQSGALPSYRQLNASITIGSGGSAGGGGGGAPAGTQWRSHADLGRGPGSSPGQGTVTESFPRAQVQMQSHQQQLFAGPGRFGASGYAVGAATGVTGSVAGGGGVSSGGSRSAGRIPLPDMAPADVAGYASYSQHSSGRRGLGGGAGSGQERDQGSGMTSPRELGRESPGGPDSIMTAHSGAFPRVSSAYAQSGGGPGSGGLPGLRAPPGASRALTKENLNSTSGGSGGGSLAAGAGQASASTVTGTAEAASVAAALSTLSISSGESGKSGSTLTGLESASAEGGGSGGECRRFGLDQLQAATNNFHHSNLLGRGAFGDMYKGKLVGCRVAVKRLHGATNAYRTEVEVLSRMRHPHIVLLMGHCPEEHCLVYEFLPGGSLQRYLEGAPGCRPLRWTERVRILSEISSALFYLHHHEPPIVHRNLTPENVMLDANLASKLGDVGLARLIDEDDTVTASAKGTPGYIDPEEILTCEVSVLSDVYAFGLIALQLLLGEGVVARLQKRLNEAAGPAGRGGSGASATRALSRTADALLGKLDPAAGEWPQDLARQVAVMALRCCDPQRLRRPDLAEEILPLLQRAADRAMAEAQRQRETLESQLICPLSQVRMTDPVVASDGFTYERGAIEQWMEHNNASPCTGEPLPHKFLTPNNGIRQLMGL